MDRKVLGLGAALSLVSQGAFAGISAIPPTSTAVPIDSPWVIAGIALSLAVIGARILKNRS